MKKLVALLAIVLFAGSTAFATGTPAPKTLHDNSTTNKKGEGTFKCTVIDPLTVTQDVTTVELGTFVVSSTEYTQFDNSTITFTITGAPTYKFNYTFSAPTAGDDETYAKITVVLKDGADAELGASPLTLSAADATSGLGSYTIKAVATKVLANKAGEAELKRTLTVSYTAL
jgi:hypothetical protein